MSECVCVCVQVKKINTLIKKNISKCLERSCLSRNTRAAAPFQFFLHSSRVGFVIALVSFSYKRKKVTLQSEQCVSECVSVCMSACVRVNFLEIFYDYFMTTSRTLCPSLSIATSLTYAARALPE